MRSIVWTMALSAVVAVAGAGGVAAQPLTLSFEAGAVFFHRDAGNAVPLFRDGATPVVSNTPADGLGAMGGMATVTGMAAGWGFELRGIFTRPASNAWRATVDPAGNYIAYADAGPEYGMGGGGDYDLFADRSTSFRSLEANLLRPVDGIRLILGLRAMRIGDELTMTIAPVIVAPYASHAGLVTDNRLIGPQIGVAGGGALAAGVDLSAFVRMGFLRNQATGNFRTSITDGPQDFEEEWDDAATLWSLFAELGVDVTFEVTERLSVVVGGSMLFINNIATTTASLGAQHIGNFTGELAFETAIYQGARIGLRLSF